MADEQKPKKKGVYSKRKSVKVDPLPYNPELKHVSKKRFLELRQIDKEARAAADEARAKVLKERGISPVEASKKAEVEDVKSEIEELKEQIKETKEALEADPNSKRLANRLNKLMGKLEDAENALNQ